MDIENYGEESKADEGLTSDELVKVVGKKPKKFEDLKLEPIKKPIFEYLNQSKIYEEEDERENTFLKKEKDKLDELISTGIYGNSKIAKLYQSIFDIYQRLLWAYLKNVQLANLKIKEILEIVNEQYTSNEKVNEMKKKYHDEYDKLLQKVQEKSEGLQRKDKESKNTS